MQRRLRLRARKDEKRKLKARCIMTGIVGMQEEPPQAANLQVWSFEGRLLEILQNAKQFKTNMINDSLPTEA
jgi:hypothetical protein